MSASKIITPRKSKIKVRDPKDQIILDTALTAGANYLITVDKDLLYLSKPGTSPIVNKIELKLFIIHLKLVGAIIKL